MKMAASARPFFFCPRVLSDRFDSAQRQEFTGVRFATETQHKPENNMGTIVQVLRDEFLEREFSLKMADLEIFLNDPMRAQKLAPRQAEILRQYYGFGESRRRSMNVIARMEKCSRENLFQIRNRALRVIAIEKMKT